MKIDNNAKEKLVNNLKAYVSKFNNEINTMIRYITRSDSVEILMRAKQNILKIWAYHLPVYDNTCYFCLISKTCSQCEYGKIHKICGDPDSSWKIIKDKQNDLLDSLENYYSGEIYNDKKLPKRKTLYCHNCGSKFRRIAKEGITAFCTNCNDWLFENK